MAEIHDLRSALEFLKDMPGQLLVTDTEVDCNAEVSGVYRHVGSGGTVKRPTKEGHAMVFNNVKGFDDAKVCIGMLSSRKRVAALLGMSEQYLGLEMGKKLSETIPPAMIEEGKHIDCQEVVHLATDPDFDLRKLVPAPTNTPEDAGPYVTTGLVAGHSPINNDSDVTIHRLCIESKDTMGMWITPGSRHLGVFFDQWKEKGEDMPVTVSIGLDPAVYMCAGFEAPTMPLDTDENDHDHLAAVADQLEAEFRAQLERYIELVGHKPDYIHNHAYGTLTTDRITRELSVEYGVMCSVGLNDRPEVKQMGMGWYKWGGPEEQLTEDPLGYITSDHDGFLTSGKEYGYLVSHCGYADADLFRLTSFTTCRPMDLDCMTSAELRAWLDENDIELASFNDLPRVCGRQSSPPSLNPWC